MRPETIREWLDRTPFQPFEIMLSNGNTHEVRHPEMIVVGKREAVVYTPDNDSFSFVALVHINELRPLQSA